MYNIAQNIVSAFIPKHFVGYTILKYNYTFSGD